MSDLNNYKITELSDTVQFGLNGGVLKYVSTGRNFVFSQQDENVLCQINSASAIFSDSISILSSTGTLSIHGAQLGYDSGSLHFIGSGSVIIPVGVNAARPSSPKVGMLRFNTESSPYLETFNGTQWVGVSSTAAGATTQIQYNSSGQLSANSRLAITFNELQATTTLKIGDPSSFTHASSTSSIAYIDGGISTDGKQGTNINIRGGNNSGTGNGGNAIISGGYAIGAGTQAGNVVLLGGESSVGNHGHVLIYTVDQNGGTAERLKICGGTGAWGLEGNNYGTSGQVLTSNGHNSSPAWTTLSSVMAPESATVYSIPTYATNTGLLLLDNSLTSIDSRGVITAAGFNSSSTIRNKTNVQNLGLSYIHLFDLLEPKEYDRLDNNKHEFGFIAEDMIHIYPEIVSKDSNGLVSGIDYTKLSTILTAKIKQQSEEINSLKNSVSELITALNELTSLIKKPT